MWPAVLHLISGLMMEMPGTKLMVVTGDSIGLVGVTECVGGGGGMSVISLCTWKIKKEGLHYLTGAKERFQIEEVKMNP